MAKKEITIVKDNFWDINFLPGVKEARIAIQKWVPWLYLLISSSFYLRTYDSAQVKITLVQMGGITLIGFWLILLILEGKKAFRKEDFIFLAPFFCYLGYVIISFFHVPYKGPSVDDFIRYIIYMSVSLVVIREFDINAIEKLTKILIITAYIATIYGFIQILDINFFPAKEIGPGIDPFIWRGAFGTRIFSTYGNPNFFGNFIVLMFPIIITQYLKTKSVYYIPLIFLELLCLYFTYTKGAWIGFGISTIIFIALYIYFFTKFDKKKILKTYIALFILAIAVIIGVVIYAKKTSHSSIPFRVATWLSTWEMINTHPMIGTGVGVFKVIYPTYRRPVIFHIEGKHNTETDHAENEHLEQIMDNGIIGAGLFYWIIVFVTYVALRAISFNTANIKEKNPPVIAYDILGYLTAFLGMLIHNFTDVSMRFVSSGVYLGLLPGVILNLSRGYALWQLHYMEESTKKEEGEKNSTFIDNISNFLKIISLSALAFFIYKIFSEFSDLQGPFRNYSGGGDSLQWLIAWSVFIFVIFFAGYSFFKIIVKGRTPLASLVLFAILWPLYYFWGWFKADVYHNMAIFFSKQGKWDDALSYYQKVNKYNPYFIMPYYFKGNVYNDRFNMQKIYKPEWGDTNEVPRTDFERAFDEYEKVRRIAPNYVQMHHQMGNLYFKMYEYLMSQGKKEEAIPYLDKAMSRYELYENLDPVFPYNYFRKAHIWMIKREFEKAEKEYLNYINAWKCYVPGHKHESPEAYTNLGNLHYMMGKHKEALDDFKKALELDPNFEPAKKNFQILNSIVNIKNIKYGGKK